MQRKKLSEKTVTQGLYQRLVQRSRAIVYTDGTAAEPQTVCLSVYVRMSACIVNIPLAPPPRLRQRRRDDNV